ncbi:MAG: hypothetical protein AB7V58_18085 [Solirubrobacterales bacterium]
MSRPLVARLEAFEAVELAAGFAFAFAPAFLEPDFELDFAAFFAAGFDADLLFALAFAFAFDDEPFAAFALPVFLSAISTPSRFGLPAGSLRLSQFGSAAGSPASNRASTIS